jgi:hypothetical protein
MEFRNGYVTISAADVPLRQLLTEWARLGQTRVVNLEKLSGAPLTIELANVPEKQALETILRGVPGYLVAQRETPIAGRSQFDRIVVMPGIVAPPSRAAAPPPPQPQPMPPPQQVPPQQVPPQQVPYAVDDQDQPVQEEMPEQPTPDTDAAPPPVMHQPGILPMPPRQGQEKEAPPAGPVPAPFNRGTISSPSPGQLPVPQQKPPEQQ